MTDGVRVAPPSLRRRLAAVLYDALLVSGVLVFALFPLGMLHPILPAGPLVDSLKALYLWGVGGAYFTVFWRKGQTLAMKTWRLRLTAADGGPPVWGRLWLRYLLASLNLALLGLGWWLAGLRADRQFIQDQLAGTRLERVDVA